ncbi:syncoilin [Alosa sapidissima]|uniref:syncoilin n=1 Tax=Alosa sapidissima TaxID=34773 RepID=UPI001C07F90F|nr:syncoilin [Alosa sapidissima]
MADQDSDLFFDPSCDALTTSEALPFEPLFIHEEEDGEKETQAPAEEQEEEEEEEEEEEQERFEDCVEELTSALGFSRRCRAAMEEEFSGLMAQMMAEIEEYDSLLNCASLGCCPPLGEQGGILGGILPAEDYCLTAGQQGGILGGILPVEDYCLTPGQYGGILGGILPADGFSPLAGQCSVVGGNSGGAAGALPQQGALKSAGDTGLLPLTGEGDESSRQRTSGEQDRRNKNGDGRAAVNMAEVMRTSGLGSVTPGVGVSPVTELTPGVGLSPGMEVTVEAGEGPVTEVGPVTELTPGVGVSPGMEVTVGAEVDPVTEETVESEAVVTRDLGELGALFEGCIAEVGRLEQRRDELVTELLELERPLAEGVQALRDELTEAHTQLHRCGLQKEDLKDSIRLLKRQLFAVARACAQSQVELSSRKHEAQKLSNVQEELQAQVQALTDEAAHLRSEHAGRLQSLQEQQEVQENSSSSSTDLSDGRRASCDLQQYLQGALSALEEWYEPRLVALLKRREGGQEALQKTREQAQGLRTQLGPLRDEHDRLQLQRTCLEERFHLMEDQRRETILHYKETVQQLEESSRQLKMELQMQQRKTREMEAVKNNLLKQLCLYRASPENHEEVKPPALGDHSNQQPSMVEVQT